ncbi:MULTISPECIES: L-threonylcarbamoyladenylate synthase [Lysinibacillus]|uniref:L-threonylcarbamoyladenylate synthase n=1 Tax=Lysinibacillus TaxID=400634 RepID=UPI001245C87C|nr:MULTISPECIES: L-threonylcarbamoyladenylate synthase [Lysinibacillus]MDC6270318.1 L-threonylcarbamoyladenylate synthase [Lysinibacillus sphaericus]KAB0441247.1 threonylcarbamoyl-AMP synthase [Lysinibacillus fusiformis]MCT6818152.1 L-threonylcarbamoyladenylate synthase [Lysinibacillus fusiformis]MCT6929824.1 L-threonylcarbamoyladenylate synthase [Lysinibacillus fusiformis]MCT6934158.1 L-threonylcarbamoyladenylate synthase [Lysinibacillus fusiformis]
METVCKVVDSNVNSQINYTQAVDILNAGEVVAFPTETVYGLGAVATNDVAVKKIFEAKGRPSDNPLIVHVGTKEEVTNYIEHISDIAKQCMDLFWPGPLTLVMPAKPNVLAQSVTAGLSTVGIRMPDHPVALALLQQLQKPLAAPSANRSGKPSPTEAIHVLDDLGGYIPYILDGGSTGIGLESTVLDVTHEPPVILRPGGITKEMLEAKIGPVIQPTKIEQKLEETPKAPGMKYTHYAPNAPVYLINCHDGEVSKAVQQLQQQGHAVALLAPENFQHSKADFYFSVGEEGSKEEMGASLYHALRACDKTTATVILATTTSTEGVGAAIMNRLEKASGGKWYSL